MNNLSHQAASHTLKAGVDVLINLDDITYPRSIRGASAHIRAEIV